MPEQFTFFLRGKLSQWAYSPFILNGNHYNCAEQFMMSEKAKLFGDLKTWELIMQCTAPPMEKWIDCPREQQRLGRLVKGFDLDIWNKNARNIVYKANIEKFTQNIDCRDILLATYGTTLVECNPKDPIWGIGMDENNPDRFDRSKWKGTNWLGEVLTKVCNNLYNEQVGIAVVLNLLPK